MEDEDPASQNARLYSLQLISDALASSGRRLGQITFLGAGSTDKETALVGGHAAGIVRQSHQGRNSITHTNLDASVERNGLNPSPSNAAPRYPRV